MRSMSTASFLASTCLILVLGLGFLGALHYAVNLSPGNSPITSYKLPVTSQPTSLSLDITSPDDNILVYEKQVLISGKTTSLGEILISSDTNDVVVTAKKDGTFSYLYNLDNGLNELNLVAFDSFGNQKEAFRTVYYSKEEL